MTTANNHFPRPPYDSDDNESRLSQEVEDYLAEWQYNHVDYELEEPEQPPVVADQPPATTQDSSPTHPAGWTLPVFIIAAAVCILGAIWLTSWFVPIKLLLTAPILVFVGAGVNSVVQERKTFRG
nr:MAG TPA: hypothetical protein [Caudoviricetes sp.]